MRKKINFPIFLHPFLTNCKMKTDLSPVLQIFAFTMLVLLPLYIYKNGVFYRADAKNVITFYS